MIELYLEKPGDLKQRQAPPCQQPQDNEVKVRVLLGGICGSDLRVYRGSIGYASYPNRPGHEALGVVVAAGKHAGLAAGDKVVVFPNTYCGVCEFCQQGRTNVCRQKQSLGINAPGVFGAEIIIDAKYVVPVPADMQDTKAILVEPFAVTVHAFKKANITTGTSVAIVGCGTEGLLAVALACYYGANVTVMDINPRKLAIAKELGANRAVQPQEVDGEWFDVVIEAAGVKQSIEQAMRLVKPCGTLIAIGITGDQVDFPAIHIVRNEISIFGTIIYTKADFAAAIELLNKPNFFTGQILSKVVPVADFKQAYEAALSGNFAKIVLDFKEA